METTGGPISLSRAGLVPSWETRTSDRIHCWLNMRAPFDVGSTRSSRLRRASIATTSAALVTLGVATTSAHNLPPRYPAVMTEIGARFDRLRQAIVARDADRARYELRQITTLFNRDLLMSEPPRNLPGMDLDPGRRKFVADTLPALEDPLATKDWKRATEAFQSAVAACKDCHQTTGVAFIEIQALPSPKQKKPATKPSSR